MSDNKAGLKPPQASPGRQAIDDSGLELELKARGINLEMVEKTLNRAWRERVIEEATAANADELDVARRDLLRALELISPHVSTPLFFQMADWINAALVDLARRPTELPDLAGGPQLVPMPLSKRERGNQPEPWKQTAMTALRCFDVPRDEARLLLQHLPPTLGG